MSTSVNPPDKYRVAVVGAGITGAVAASELAKLASQSSAIHCDDRGIAKNEAFASGNTTSNSGRPQDTTENLQVVVFDQGRRGPGGRASHRSVSTSTGQVLADDLKNIQEYTRKNNEDGNNDMKTYQFDHGCQFFRADSSLMQKDLLETWLEKGWAEPWNARFGCLTMASDDKTNTENGDSDFFGVPTALSNGESSNASIDENVYIGVGGMHLLPRRILDESSSDTTQQHVDSSSNNRPHHPLVVHRGNRVQGVSRNSETGKWDLETIGGTAAYHDTKAPSTTTTHSKSQTISNNEPTIHGSFDAVLFTDISSSFDAWHRASAGIPDSFRARLPTKIRIPLFSCMIALSAPVRQLLPYDAFTIATNQNDKLWFASVSQSKPGMYENEKSNGNDISPECWTLISTPSFAVQEIQSTTMRDEKTGEFKPQENSYLNTIPGPALAQIFLDNIRPFVEKSAATIEMPKIVYLQAQRWGSGLPAPESIVKSTVDICGTTYVSELKTLSMVFPRPPPSSCGEIDFVADDALGLYYAGDFCSHRNPGLEAASLSGLEVARHIWMQVPQAFRASTTAGETLT
ncbi:unnamed protein product [Cylindrotheca closterium]|uniref:Uncharacterized protein n=1 Tax=Cylindrotheca closterium TaxID=2856 RepID=A0AAD2G2B2_9STRA|nr:unnamed protein product [Cylindrotheca closterium]